MKDDTIKINREMLREAVMKCNHYASSNDLAMVIEYELFGPKKPREWLVWAKENAMRCVLEAGDDSQWKMIRVREVLG